MRDCRHQRDVERAPNSGARGIRLAAVWLIFVAPILVADSKVGRDRWVRLQSDIEGGSSGPATPSSRGGSATLRELTTDRPDATESPFTVDRQHVQLEMDVASFTRNRLDGVETTEWVLAPFNVRYGLAHNVEAGVFLVPHVRVTEQPRGEGKTRTTGIGDTVLRAKINFWGNDGGSTALGMIADLKLPTAREGLGNDHTEGALSFPLAYELGAGWDGAAMTSVEFAHTDVGRRAIWVNTITFAHAIGSRFGGFLELTSAAGDGAHVATFNCGLTRPLRPGVQLDCGINVGLSRTAPDLTVFAGLARKF
jgi:hypothetical protein